MAKKKISFDIDPQLLYEIRNICETKKIALSDFMRESAEAKLKLEKQYMNIFIIYHGRIESYAIKRTNYNIDIYPATDAMRKNVGAECEGKITKINFFDFDNESKKNDKENITLDDMLNDEPYLRFYTTRKYCY